MKLSSSTCSLQLEADGQLCFALAGQPRWVGAPVLFILHYYDRQHPRAETVSVPSMDGYAYGTAGTPSLGTKGEMELVATDENEIRVVARFASIHIVIGLTLRLNEAGDGFSLCIKDDDVAENMPALYRVLGIEVLPDFGAAVSGEKGYLTLPNWSGCQTFFDKTYPREVRQTIYSSNDQWEHVCNMPVFGITRSHGTLCGLVTDGDYDAQLVCRVHWQRKHLNGVHPHFIYRWQQQDVRLAGRREVRYSFAPGDYDCGEGYVFCGKECREFLRAERGLKTWDEKACTHPSVLDYRDRFFLKIFMAFKEPRADGRGPYHATCTFAETREILQTCVDRGMGRLAVMLVGWGQDGHDGMPPTRFPADERLGGEKAFRELIAWCADNDIMIGVHDSYGESYACSPEFDLADVIRHRTGEPWQGVIWSGGQVHKTCPSVFIEKHTKRDVPAVRNLGIHGHHHIDAIGSFMTCHSKDHPLERRADFAGEIRRMFTYIREVMGSVSTEMPFGPYFPVVDGFLHSYSHPSTWHRASSVGRHFQDRSIPLLSVVLHGINNCGESAGKLLEQPMHWLDWGLCPNWEVCMRPSPAFGIPAYPKVADQMEAIYQLHYGGECLLSMLNPLLIDARWELPGGLTRTRYSDGTVVTVNPTSNDTGELAAHSYNIETPVLASANPPEKAV